jgi:hypothetical protein
MPSKENYCYQILKKYSLIIDFDGTPRSGKVPSPVNGETYGRWKDRVLGSSVQNVVLYVPSEPAHQKRINTLQNQAGAEHLEKIFRAFATAKEKQRKSDVDDAITKAEQRFESFSKDTLKDLLADYNGTLEPSVQDFVDGFLDGVSHDIDTEEIICKLLKVGS